jgi:MoxR-like ATPase
MTDQIAALNEKVAAASTFVDKLVDEVGRTIVGQHQLVERLLVGLLARGHVLVEGLPGLAKSLSISTLAACLDASFNRIQFTPDLLPADLVGTQIFDQKSGEFTTRPGPIFANFILADEINRAPAKVQSALLESMQERQVTIGGKTYPLQEPFLVMATQNPIEQEGTYPLPEAQIDRFMLKLKVNYPEKAEEKTIIERMAGGNKIETQKVVSIEEILTARKVVEEIYVDDKIKNYVIDVVFATREPEKYGLAEVANFIEYGASPRASLSLIEAGRAHAFIHHRGYVTPDDIKALGQDVLRHRLIISYEAEAEDVTAEDLVQRVFESVEVP